MFETILTRLFPASLLGGLALYLLVTMLWLQPLVERRMAALHLVPACETALVQDRANTPAPRNQAQAEADITVQILDMLFKGTGLDQIPEIDQTMDVARGVVEGMTPKQPRISQIDKDSVCGCSVDQTFSDLGFAMTLHVASARSYADARVVSLPQNTFAIARSGQCGELPWRKG